MVQVAILTIIASMGITFAGLLAARKTRAMQQAERERILQKKKGGRQSLSRDQSQSINMAGGGVNNLTTENMNLNSGERLAATGSSAR